MLKEYMSKLPFLQGSQNKRSRQKPADPAPKPVEPEEELMKIFQTTVPNKILN